MILSQTDPTLRRVSFTVLDADGNPLSGLGSSWSAGELQTSANGAGLVNASGSVREIGGGAYYYQASLGDASNPGSLIVYAAKTGQRVTVADEAVNALGYSFTRLGETDATQRRVFFVIYDPSSVPTSGLSFSGAEVQVSYDGAPMVTAPGAVTAVGSGVYYYGGTMGDVGIAGDLLLRINKVGYQAVIIRRLVLGTGVPIVSIPQVTQSPPPLDVSIIAGFDIALPGGDFVVTDAGDWGLVGGVPCARQSVLREIPATVGSFPRRPTYGGGVAAMIFKGATKATRDKAVSSARVVLHRNPRIKRINDVSAGPSAVGQGIVITLDADAVDGRLTAQIPLKPVRGQ